MSIQSSLTFWSYQKEALFETPYLSREDFEHFLGLTKGDPVVPPLDSENGEKDVLKRRNPQMLAHQFKRPHQSIRVGVNL